MTDATSEEEAQQMAMAAMANLADVFVGSAHALCPTHNAAAVVAEYGKPFGQQSISLLTDLLNAQVDAVNKGDIRQFEAMLLGQAAALQSIFMNLSRSALAQKYTPQLDAFLRLGLKAQSQCRATIETLAAIKNPAQLAFIRQANIGQAVQVNNAPTTPRISGARKNENQPSKLLEASHDEGLDIRATCISSRSCAPRETVGTVDRPKERTRKGTRGA